MTDVEEIRSLMDALRAPARKGGLFGAKRGSKTAQARVDAARRFAQLATQVRSPDGSMLETLERVAAEYSTEPSLRTAYAGALAAAGRSPEAINEYEENLREHPHDGVALAAVAGLYERSGRSDLAIDRLRRAVDEFVGSQRLDEAVDAARRLIALEPQSLEHASDLVAILRAREPALLVEALEHIADIYRERGKLGQEADACRELLTLDSERQDVKHRLAAIYTRILEVDPDDGDAWFGLAAVDEVLADQLRVLLLRETTDVPVAQAPEAAPPVSHEAYASRKAQELIDAGDVQGAIFCLERAIRTGGDPRNHLQLAQCYLDLHREADAVRQGLRALAQALAADDAAQIDGVLGWLAGVKPDAQEAVADAVFLNQRPESADILYEELLHRWDDAQANSGVGALREPE